MIPEASPFPHFYQGLRRCRLSGQSLSRGAYWIGRAIEDPQAIPNLPGTGIEKAAVHITTYYGQLALAKLTGDTIPPTPPGPLCLP